MHFVIGALLKLSGSMKQQDLLGCWTMLLELFPGKSPRDILGMCIYELLALLTVELGKQEVRAPRSVCVG